MKTLVLGVDPGLSGALALYDFEVKRLVEVKDMPVRPTGLGGKNGIDLAALSVWIGAYSSEIAVTVIEEVGVMGGHEGTVSMFNFGYGAGAVAGVVAGCMIPLLLVKPAVWKSLMGLSSNKDLSRRKAIELFPSAASQFSRKKDDGRAEAALLAFLGSERFVKGYT